jgi:hypothetical protein
MFQPCPGSVEHPSFHASTFHLGHATGSSQQQVGHVRYAPIATKFRAAPK